MRIGHGYDTHRFGAERPLMLGGVTIPYQRGLVAHSDGDVVIHALCDALLGAAALGDIGVHFPDDSAACKNMDSRVILREVRVLLARRSYALCNADVTVLAEEPKLAPHVNAMRSNLAADLGVAPDAVSVKATTNEKMGFIGNREGIAAYAVVLIDGRAGFDDGNM